MAGRLPLRRSPALPRGSLPAEDIARRLHLMPAGVMVGGAAAAAAEAGQGYALAGGPLVFTACAVLLREDDHVLEAVAPVPAVREWSQAAGAPVADHVAALLENLSAARRFAGFACDRPLLMGVVNVTPDSFSDGGRFLDADAAIGQGLALAEAGADILDVGGESTRPGARPVPPEEEMERVVPVVRALAERDLCVSIDTRHARVMAAALAAGARIVNDVTALAGDPEALSVCARQRVPVVLMHMQGEPQTMQANPVYDFVATDVYDFMAERIAACRDAGLEDICIDPGIGFGKALDHNLSLLARLGLLHGLGRPMLLGVSRKSFIGRLTGIEEATARLPGSLAAAQAGLGAGVNVLRVHDVAETRQAVAVWRALVTSS